MDEELLQAAISKLEFRDIVLHTCKLDRPAQLDPVLYPTFVQQKAEHEVVTDRLFFADADDEEVEILQNYIRFLISAFVESAEDEDPGSVGDTPLFWWRSGASGPSSAAGKRWTSCPRRC
jgi:hypothetical protein